MTEPIAPESRLLVGRYRFDRRIGHGGMGTVWAAHDEILGRNVAVKEVVPPADLTEDQRRLVRERTLREARAAARIAHPSAVTVYDVVEEDGRPYIVMQLLAPHTLADVLAAEGALPPERVARIGLDLVDALAAAHRAGVLHRDVKPANVLISPEGRAVLTDFGIASVENDPTLTATGMLVGSPAYMPPERARGERPSPAADLWSLGATLFAAVEGQPPFRRDGQLQTLNAVLTEPVPATQHAGPLAPAIDALLARDPALRPDADRTRELLEQAVAEATATPPVPDQTVVVGGDEDQAHATELVDVSPTVETARTAPPPGPPDQPAPVGVPPAFRPDRDRRRGAAALVAALVLLLAAAALAVHVLQDGGTPAATPTPSVTPTARSSSGTTSATSSPQSASSSSAASGKGSSSSTSGSASGSGASSSSGGGSDDAVPAGFHRYTDPTGFSLNLPNGWQPTRKGSTVTFQRSGSRAYLLVPQTTTPQPDSLVDWQNQERAASPRFPGYRRLRLERVPFRSGWDVADWEFLWTPSSGTLHVLDRNLRVSDHRAYALYWSVPAEQWTQLQPTFAAIAHSFRPAP